MPSDFRLLMVSAMYENGGNTVHRFLDGHPQLLVYPFESQLGTALSGGLLGSMFPRKYRWPVFALDASPAEDYAAILDEECRVRARTPHVSKFRHVPFDFSDVEREARFVKAVAAGPRTRGGNVAAFFRATFEAWRDYSRPAAAHVHVGYSPIVAVDAETILADLPGAHVLHVVRNPWSAYADTKKRPVPMSLVDYMLAWTVCQYRATFFSERFPGRFHVVRVEDVLADPERTLGGVLGRLSLEGAPSLRTPTWNGRELAEIAPWGTIRRATPEANRATAEELSPSERAQVRARAGGYLEVFDYASFLQA